MLARLQRLITCGLMTASMAWVVACVAWAHPISAVLGAVCLVFGYTVFLAVEFVFVYAVGNFASPVPATVGELFQAWWGEIGASPQVFFWRQPFRTNTEPDSLPASPDRRRGVLLVHGFVCNRAFWNPWMATLRRSGTSFVAVNLEPPFGSIGNHVETIEHAVGRLTAATGVPPLVIAHSMGGLVVRHWLCMTGDLARIHRVITIGTPHGGTWLARFSRTVPGTEMAMDSTWLQKLDISTPAELSSRFTCFYGNADNVVFPASGAQLRGADNRLLKRTAHVCLAFHGQVFDEALRCLAAGSPD